LAGKQSNRYSAVLFKENQVVETDSGPVIKTVIHI